MRPGGSLKIRRLPPSRPNTGVSLPQVCIRYVLQKNVLPLPKAVHPEYIRQNAAVDFTLSDEDMAYFDGLTDTER